MKRTTTLVSSLALIASLNVFAAHQGEETTVGTIRARTDITKTCGFVIEHPTSNIAFGESGIADNPGKISATSNFPAFFGLKVNFADNETLGLKWIAKSDQGQTREFAKGDDHQFVQLNNQSEKVRSLVIDLFPRLTKVNNELEMESGQFETEATITMKCHELPLS
ncbi:MAG: hypothetical protein ACRC9R_04010 [Enterovibrio sp.]